MNFQSGLLTSCPNYFDFLLSCWLRWLFFFLWLFFFDSSFWFLFFGSSAFTSSFFVSNGEFSAFNFNFLTLSIRNLLITFPVNAWKINQITTQLRLLAAQLRFSAYDLQLAMMKISALFLVFLSG